MLCMMRYSHFKMMSWNEDRLGNSTFMSLILSYEAAHM